jgi:hypothetical protein
VQAALHGGEEDAGAKRPVGLGHDALRLIQRDELRLALAPPARDLRNDGEHRHARVVLEVGAAAELVREHLPEEGDADAQDQSEGESDCGVERLVRARRLAREVRVGGDVRRADLRRAEIEQVRIQLVDLVAELARERAQLRGLLPGVEHLLDARIQLVQLRLQPGDLRLDRLAPPVHVVLGLQRPDTDVRPGERLGETLRREPLGVGRRDLHDRAGLADVRVDRLHQAGRDDNRTQLVEGAERGLVVLVARSSRGGGGVGDGRVLQEQDRALAHQRGGGQRLLGLHVRVRQRIARLERGDRVGHLDLRRGRVLRRLLGRVREGEPEAEQQDDENGPLPETEGGQVLAEVDGAADGHGLAAHGPSGLYPRVFGESPADITSPHIFILSL